MYDVVVFAALGWEARAVVHGLSGVEGVERGVWRGYLGDGASCLVIATGVGPQRAARAVAAAPPARLHLACGCAGALVDWLRSGDLVAATAIVGLAGTAMPSEGVALAARAAARG